MRAVAFSGAAGSGRGNNTASSRASSQSSGKGHVTRQIAAQRGRQMKLEDACAHRNLVRSPNNSLRLSKGDQNDGRLLNCTNWTPKIAYAYYRMSKTSFDTITTAERDNTYRELYSGFIRLHVLHHAAREDVFGLGLIEELQRHGYKISPGSLYPMLHGLEARGYLRSKATREGRAWRKEYRATALGKKALRAAKNKIRELFHELVEEDE